MKTNRLLLVTICSSALIFGRAFAESSGKSAQTDEKTGSTTTAPSGQGAGKHDEKSGNANATPSGHDAGKSSDKPAGVDGQHSSAKGPATTGNKPVSADPDLNPVFPPNRPAENPLHATQKLIGSNSAKKPEKGTKSSFKSSAVLTKPTSTPKAGPMAAAEANSTGKVLTPRPVPMATAEAAAVKKAFIPTARPMAAAESAALHKITGPEGTFEVTKAEGEPEAIKAFEHPNPAPIVPSRSILNGTSTAPQRGKAPALTVLGGIKNTGNARSTAAINGTTFR